VSTAVFPTLPLLGFPKRTPEWQTRKPTSISGKETAIADWSYPRWTWEYPIDGLRQAGANQQVATFNGGVWSEFATLVGFYNARQGGFDSFLYQDPTDNTVTGQSLGVGNASATSFQLVRAFGGDSEPIFAPNLGATFNVYLNGTLQSPSSYTKNGWGSSTPGTIVFTSAPGSGVTVSADFSYYFPCRFVADKCDFQQLMAGLWSCKSLAFKSIK
jgi:uncharacterized protein (TIGR02217 family)